MSVTNQPRAKSQEALLRISDEYTRSKHQRSAEGHLHGRRERRRVHEAMAHPGDGRQFNQNNDDRHGRGNVKVVDEVWQGMPNTTKGSHGATDEPAKPRSSAPGEAAIVGERLGKSHADAGAQ